MTQLVHTVVIEKPHTEVYALASQVERHPEFLPGYLKTRIIDRQNDAWLLERVSVLQGRLYRWKSLVRFDENQAIHFEQTEGPLRGMLVDWYFESLGPFQTRVTIVHQLHLKRPWGIGRWMERFVFKPKINAMASQVVQALKRRCETQDQKTVLV